MLPFAADENFNNNIVRGLLRQQPGIDIATYRLETAIKNKKVSISPKKKWGLFPSQFQLLTAGIMVA